MKTIFSDRHRLQCAKFELFGGTLVPCHERPARADAIRARLEAAKLGPIIEPLEFGRDPIVAVHSSDYVDFLMQAWSEWSAAGGEGDAISGCAPKPDMDLRVPASFFAKLGYYSFDATAPITAGTWEAAYAAAQVALTGADLLTNGEPAAFSLCRPPGHHASRAYCAGYCFLNNAAVAAQSLVHKGMDRVAILDVDYHHGNGTQSIFYDRDDVLFVSIHGDPREDYPFFLGHAGETGAGRGGGYNHNFPLPHGTTAARWFEVLQESLNVIAHYAPDAVVVSLGVDTYAGDPISHFKLESDDYLRLGDRIASLAKPTLFVMEGGYNLDAIGVNVTNVLQGFAGAATPGRHGGD